MRRKARTYINLTCGQEWLLRFPALTKQCAVTRIQSTWCEQKQWSRIIEDLDHDLLYNLARGERCVILDASHDPPSRAIWQGLPWIAHALNKKWHGVNTESSVRGNNVTGYFNEQVAKLSHRAKTKLHYYKHHVTPGLVHLLGRCIRTDLDGGPINFLDNKELIPFLDNCL